MSRQSLGAAGNRAGEVIAGRYRLDRLLAIGGMGAVYEATHVVTNKRFALKLMHPGMVSDASARERFVREAQAPAEIRHDGIVDVLDAGTDEDGTLFLAMEHLDGESLMRYFSRPGITLADALGRIFDMLEPLAAAHERGFVHRDLKPDNVFVARDARGKERVKLLDFGIARQQQSESLTRSGAFLGTLRYISPEQARSPRDATPASDVWSVGAMLYELCAGVPPFEGEDAELVVAAATRPHRPLQAIDAALPTPLCALVDQCLAKAPGDRPRDAAVLRQELAVVLNDASVGKALRSTLAAQASRTPSHVRASAVTLDPRELTTDDSERDDLAPSEPSAPTMPISPDDTDVPTDVAPTRRPARDDPPLDDVPTRVLAPAPAARAVPVITRPATPTRRGPVPAIALVLVAGALLVAVILVTRAGVAPSSTTDATARRTYRVAVTVEPSSAELSLDGERVAGPVFVRELARDGREHRLAAHAPGYVAATMVFRDAPPPGSLVLAPLPTTPIGPLPVVAPISPAPGASEPPDVVRPPPARQHEISPSTPPIRYGPNKAPVIR